MSHELTDNYCSLFREHPIENETTEKVFEIDLQTGIQENEQAREIETTKHEDVNRNELEHKSNSFGFGMALKDNEVLEEVVDIAHSDEEPSVIDESIEENIMYQNANLVPIAPRKSKSREAPPESSFDDVLMEKFKHGKPCEQAQIL